MKTVDRNTIRIELNRFEDNKAVLLTPTDDEIILPKKVLPIGVKEGDSLVMTFSTSETEVRAKEKKAKEILNEILNIN